MNAKSNIALFITLLLSLLAGSTAYAQGPYDSVVAAKFVGVWLNLKTGRNYAVIEATPTAITEKGCKDTLTNCSVAYPNVIRSGKLYSSYILDARDYPDWPYPTGWWAEVTIELSILDNGHLQSAITERYSFGQVTQRTAEYVRVSGPAVAPTPVPVVPVVPVQPVGPGAGIPACSEVGYTPGLIQQVLADEPQCTRYVYYRPERNDLLNCWGGAYPNAKDWDDWARETWPGGHSQKCPNLKVNPPMKGQQPNLQDILPGDVVVWEAWCGGAKENGHVALATASNAQNGTIGFDQANWPEGSGFSHRSGVKVENCMSFIHQPVQESSAKSLWEVILDWFKGWFR